MRKKGFWEYTALALLLLCAMRLYLATASPAFKNNDSPETAAAAFTLGIGHPPGYPLFTMAAKIFTLLPLASPASRVNLFSMFLSMLVLLIAYFTVKNQIMGLFMQDEPRAAPFLSFAVTAILALSFIFWNQAADAKGGIYMLNLLFFAIIMYLSMELLQVPGRETGAGKLWTLDTGLWTKSKIKNLYLISYVFGLGLANHWPSMALLAPALIYILAIYGRGLKPAGFILCFAFVLAGLSAYLYLVIRANAGPALNFGNPRTLNDFLWVVLRQGYEYPVKPGLDVYAYQIKEFFRFFFTNFSLFILFAAAGFPAMLKKERKISMFLLFIFLVFAVAVVFYNRAAKGVLIQLDIFLIPAEYACLLFIAAGMARIYSAIKHSKAFIYSAAITASGLLCFMAIRHYALNDESRDFLSYDLGKSILATMEKDSLYFGNEDNNLMPVYYLMEVNKERRDIKFTASAFLTYEWGINDFIRRYGSVDMRPLETAGNIKNIIDSFIGGTNIYRSSHYPLFDKLPMPYEQAQKGILVKITPENEVFLPAIFDIYSYRGIYLKSCLQDPRKQDLISRYPACMVNQARDLIEAGRPKDALKLYKLAMLFPVARPEAGIYYGMSLAYNKTGDFDSELDCLVNAARKNSKLPAAFERAGVLYYDCGLLAPAKDMFLQAQRLGSASQAVKKAMAELNSMSLFDQYEYGFKKAGILLAGSDFKKAMDIYDYLLAKNYRAAEIQRNLGLYYFSAGKYSDALDRFSKSGSEAQSPEIIYYTAFSYYKMNNIRLALKTLEDGLKLYRYDKKLNDLYRQLKRL